MAEHAPRPDDPLVFASLRLCNEAGRKAMHHLGENYPTLSDHHRRYLHVQRIAHTNQIDLTDNDNDEYVPSISDLDHEQDWDGEYDISLSGLLDSVRGPAVGLTIGRGEPLSEANRGVDLLVIYPTKHSKGVMGIHAVIRLHPKTGWPMLGGVSNHHPVKFLVDNEEKNLGAGQWHALWQTTSQFFVGDIQCTLSLSKLGTDLLQSWGESRHKFFETRGLAAPDRRFPTLPLQKPIKSIGSFLIYKEMACGGCEVFSIGIDVNTGNPVEIKSCSITNPVTQAKTVKDGEVALRFPGQPGLHQAIYMCCNHGHSFSPGQHEEMRRVLSSCPVPDSIYMVSPLGRSSFGGIKMHQHNFRQIAGWFRDVLQGLATMHHAGYMHRDVTSTSMLITTESAGELWDFGKAVQRPTDTSIDGGPRYTQAPEIDGRTTYTFGADVWSYAFAFVLVCFSDLHTWKGYQPDSPQNAIWTAEAHKQLQALGSTSPLHRSVTRLMMLMLQVDPNRRALIQTILDRWSAPVSPRSATNNPDAGEPLAKKAKTVVTTKAQNATDATPLAVNHPGRSLQQVTHRIIGARPIVQNRSMPGNKLPIDHRQSAANTSVFRGAEEPTKTTTTASATTGTLHKANPIQRKTRPSGPIDFCRFKPVTRLQKSLNKGTLSSSRTHFLKLTGKQPPPTDEDADYMTQYQQLQSALAMSLRKEDGTCPQLIGLTVFTEDQWTWNQPWNRESMGSQQDWDTALNIIFHIKQGMATPSSAPS